MNDKKTDRQPRPDAAAPSQGPAGQGGALGRAFRQALPIVLGYVPVGFAYGVLAQKSGLSTANTLAMSLIVFAGSAQLIAVGLFAAMASPLSIVLTTFVVNLRHLLMSAALAPHLRSWTKAQIAALTTELTDETFALHIARFAGRKTAAQNRNKISDSSNPQPPAEVAACGVEVDTVATNTATPSLADSAKIATITTLVQTPDRASFQTPGQAPDHPAPAPTSPGSAACPRLAGPLVRIAPRIGAVDPRLALDTPAGPSARAGAWPMVPPSGAPAAATSGPTGSSPAGPGPAGSDKAEMFCVNLISQTSWVAGTWLGLVSSALVADVRPVGLDYALPAMFLALLAMQLRTRTHWLVAGAAGFGSVALLAAGVDRWNVMLATVAAAALGAGVETWTKRRSS
jgi:predicted branched-subunit amino acid permease